ncbi:hypothetical protein M9H77_32084 [Catharanthus roseus]|uniref:Uncharacterized protein n=1 Tax=Catharanthus roseus TaxID=4058 RepID=A0ACC0A1X8_CATRO|nr:hypothetical protein M9H77_32084 [Catharanthus roseus]
MKVGNINLVYCVVCVECSVARARHVSLGSKSSVLADEMRWLSFAFPSSVCSYAPEPDGCIVILTACLLSTYSSLPLYLCFCYQKNGFF